MVLVLQRSPQQEAALNQLEALKRRTDLGYVQRARIEARIAEITPVVLEMHKQGIHAGDPDPQQQLAPQPTLRVHATTGGPSPGYW